jgi:DNA-directed RNA polymerase specialized sigma24 family protein
VAGLSSRQRSIFLLRFMEEMEIPEIATVTGLPLGTVKSHLYRALAVIRAQHEMHGATPPNQPERNATKRNATTKETQ